MGAVSPAAVDASRANAPPLGPVGGGVGAPCAPPRSAASRGSGLSDQGSGLFERCECCECCETPRNANTAGEPDGVAPIAGALIGALVYRALLSNPTGD